MRTYDVRLASTRVGHLTETDNGRVAFRFFDDYKRSAPRPVLSQSFEDDLDRTYRSRRDVLPPFFANLVPEGHLREVIEKSLGLTPGDTLALLAAVSTDLPGALEIVASDLSIEIDSNGADEEVPPKSDRSITDIELRFSLAGVQMKFSLVREHDRLTLAAHGGRGEWIVKLDSSRFPRVVQNEFAVLEWARASGFDVPACQLMPVTALPLPLREHAGDSAHVLAVSRYDRAGQRRIHQEDFAQVVGLPPSHKYDQITYEQCAALVLNILGESGYHEFVARLVFMIASGNVDAHLKNWSLLYPDGVRPSLTPMYDQVATIAWPELPPKLALKFAGTRELLRIDERAFTRLAERSGGDPKKTASTVLATLDRIVGGWRSARIGDLLPDSHAAALRTYWLRAPLLKDVVLGLFST